MGLAIRRKGTVSTKLRDIEEQLQRLRPQRSVGVLTSATVGGVIRRAPVVRPQPAGTAQAYWA